MNTLKKNYAVDISPKDDAFHGSKKHIAIEWWYFDAVFTNDYSIHIGFKTFTKKDRGIVSPLIEIYKGGKLELELSKRHLFRHIKTSKKIPHVELFNKPIIKFDYDRFNKTGEWVYNVTMKIDQCEVDLTFTGISKGWKIETETESWTVALPKASVSGKIKINDEEMSVEGIGYHDHNWNYTILTVMNYGIGWYWGKIRSDTFNIVWANIVKSSKKSEVLSIVNEGEKQYFNINPENIFFKAGNFVRNGRKKAPTQFILKIDDVVDGIPVLVDVKMETKELHGSSVLIAPYWRYHVQTTGYISVGSKKETIDSTQIMEFLSFR